MIRLVSDVHGAVEALRRVAPGDSPLLILGDLINFIDYRDNEGIVSDIAGHDFVEKVVRLRSAGDYTSAGELWRDHSKGREEELRELYASAIDAAYVEKVRETLPELPDAKQQRFEADYGLKADDAKILVTTKSLADYYEAVAAATTAKPQLAANWVIGDLSGALNKEGLDIEASRISAADLAGLLDRIADNTISGKIAKEVFEAMWAGEGSAEAIIEAKGLKQITDSSAIESVVDQVIAANPGQVAEYKAGKDKLIGFFVGQVMKETGGKANPGQVNKILKDKLG